MFTPLQTILPSLLRRKGIQDTLIQIQTKEEIEKIIKDIIAIPIVIGVKHNVLTIQISHHQFMHRIRMYEEDIKEGIQKKGISIRKIKYSLL